MGKPLYQCLASRIVAMQNCARSGNAEWGYKHQQWLVDATKRYLPSGSGFDLGTQILLSVSNSSRIVLMISFHHMDEHGGYDGWTHHRVTVRPDLLTGISITVSGRNRNDIKDYIADTLWHCLTQEIEQEKE